MADIDLLFFLRPAQRNEIASLVVDATIREQHEYFSQVAEHPIETGSEVGDHILNEPVRLTMEGEVSDTPVQILGGVLSENTGDRKLEAFDTLRRLRANRQPIDVVTGLAVYRNMVISSMTFPRDARTGRRLQFIIEFRQLEFVETQVIRSLAAAENIRSEERDIAQATRNVGQANTRAATANETEKTESALRSLAGLIRGLF